MNYLKKLSLFSLESNFDKGNLKELQLQNWYEKLGGGESTRNSDSRFKFEVLLSLSNRITSFLFILCAK